MTRVLVVEDEQSLREPLVYLLQKEGYDVIEADAILPKTALSGLLNSQEFFRQVRSKLAPGGLHLHPRLCAGRPRRHRVTRRLPGPCGASPGGR